MSMPKGVQLKLDRAKEHVNALDHEVKRFLDDKPYSARRVLEDDGTQHIFLWERFSPLPDCLALMAGDAIHNLRSCLDHMAVALAKAGAATQGVMMTPEEEARIQYPVARSDEEFIKQLRRGRLLYVEPRAQAFMKDRQP